MFPIYWPSAKSFLIRARTRSSNLLKRRISWHATPAGKVVGRITAHINRRHNEFWKDRAGFFGFFESIEDLEVARALTQAAEAWLRSRGFEQMRGPFNFSTNEECGFLSEGFDRLPGIMMPYTKPYYLEFMERLGYSSVKELLAYEYDSGGAVPEYLTRLGQRGQERSGVTIRPLDMRNFEAEVSRAFQVYNSAWSNKLGFRADDRGGVSLRRQRHENVDRSGAGAGGGKRRPGRRLRHGVAGL